MHNPIKYVLLTERMSCYVYSSVIFHLNGMKFSVDVQGQPLNLITIYSNSQDKASKIWFSSLFYCAL